MVDYLKECLKEPVPREWSFPESEYRARLEKTRKAMDDAGIDVLLVHAIVDNCYLSGYQSLWPEAYACLIVPREGEPFMQVGEIEGALAVLQGYVTDIVTFSWVGADVAPTQLAQLLADRGFGNRSIGVQLGSIEMGFARATRRSCLPSAERSAAQCPVRRCYDVDVRYPGDEVGGRACAYEEGCEYHLGGDGGGDRSYGARCHRKRPFGYCCQRDDRPGFGAFFN